MPSYRLTPKARDDLAGIWRYTAETWSIEQADRYYHGLVAAIVGLVSRPELSRDISEIRPGYRSRLYRSHAVYFRIGDDGAIEVIRILHQRMDVKARLRE